MNRLRTLTVLLVSLLLTACGAVGPSTVVTHTATHDSISTETHAKAHSPDVIRVAVVSDLNGRYGSTTYGKPVHAAIERIAEMDIDLVISAGDMVAGQKSGLDYQAMWDGFHDAVTDPLEVAGIPLAVAPGNHDASGYPEFATEREIYTAVWNARKPTLRFVEDSAYPLHYAFKAGSALFIALDATQSGPISETQLRWLDGVLGRFAPEASAIIVFGHLPIHQVAEGKHRDVLRDPALEALLVRHDVDMYVSGHHQAFYPGRRGDLRLLATSCLGGGARNLMGSEERSARSFVVLELDASGIAGLEAWQGKDFTTPVDIAALPPQLGDGESLLARDHDARPAVRIAASQPRAAVATTLAAADSAAPAKERRREPAKRTTPRTSPDDDAETRVLKRVPEAMPKGLNTPQR